MELKDLQQLYSHSPQVAAARKAFGSPKEKVVFLKGLAAGALPVALSAIYSPARTMLLVMADEDAAGYAYNDLCHLLGGANVLFFPSAYKRAARFAQRDAANDVLRTETLSRLAGNDAERPLIVTCPAALAELVAEKKDVSEKLINLRVGSGESITALERRLADLGFTRTDYVYEPGQMAVRGSIVDVFGYCCELPFRIDFFGDEIDSIRTFEPDTQLSKERTSEARILPSLAAGGANVPFLRFLPDDSLVIAADFAFVSDKIGQIYDGGFSVQAVKEKLSEANETEQDEVLRRLSKENLLCPQPLFAKELSRFRRVVFGQHQPRAPHTEIAFDITPQPLFHKNFELLRTMLADYQAKGYRTCILSDSSKQHRRLAEILSTQEQTPAITLPVAVNGVLHEGFVDNDLKSCFFTDHQIFDRFHKYNLKSDRVRTGKASLTMKELQELAPGDYLVHIDFGIGRFGGLVRKPTDKGYIEEIRLVYQRGDIVDVSIHSLYKISKYRSKDTGEPPRLSTLGTGAWERLKENTKRKIKDAARDLIKLYAKRRSEKGYAFGPDTYLQQELEASFIYEDTPDQLAATQAVKSDMEAARPMDRLICGDVGFGKTEIAIRATFKAACDGKQTAVLVPTTVLAFQHFQTFSERLKSLPVKVEYLSRARSVKKSKEILAELEQGKVDILIGTHKMISEAVKWHDLGLLIIDEEQKFGVSVKEKLRKLKTNIDTITMTATPIPRTLQFSLMGARDMSIMRTPPPNRYPIETTVAVFDKETVREAINFEMSRNGQVFFINDRVSNLPEIAAMIRREVPDCRLAIGHGQMNSEELEKTLIAFINYDYDVLLATTIIENGVDIPNANTIIINDAHHFGLADLHQMRGRVGRSNRKAFCYLLAPPLAALPDDAARRLTALETFADLGAGFALSMQDLDIRGAGNLLGTEQSGFIEDLGYEAYQKILNQAVTELKNDEFRSLYAGEIKKGAAVGGEEFVDDCTIESDLEMYFPDSYVPGSSERLTLYRELDNIQTDAELEAYRKRLNDRFGPVPHEGEELMNVVLLRRLGRRLGCEKIMLKQSLLNMQFVSRHDSPYYQSRTFGNVLAYATANPRRCQLKEVKGRRLLHIANVTTVKEAVGILRCISSS
ncbi:MAG: transcription-repair coupling factor [Prevotella sp.]|nr:transcription-repair coupling factor [Prevotella sp.]